jgi:hopanoid C-3 methylase
MRVLLVQPRVRPRAGFRGGFRNMAVVEPLGLEMLAGALSGEHEVRVADLLPGTDLAAVVDRFRPDACGISCSFTIDVPTALDVAREIKATRARTFVFVGGHHASLSPHDFAAPAVDALVVGEGERTISEMIGALERGDDLRQVPGLIITGNGSLIATKQRPLVNNLDDLPFPVRSEARDHRKHYYFGWRDDITSLETSRGCPNRCTFCSVWQFHQGQMRYKSPVRVVEEMAAIEGRNVFITDDNFLASIPRAEEIADLILTRGLRKRFIYQARTDAIARHPTTVARLREAGFASVFLGLEKIDSEGMKSVRKGNTVENNEKALKVLSDVGVNPFGSFIVDPSYEESDFSRLREYITSRSNLIPDAWFTVLTPLPGTQLFEQVKESITTRNREMFDLAHAVVPTRLQLEDFYEEFARLYRTVYTGQALWKRATRRLLRTGGRTMGHLPPVRLLIRSLETYRCMTDPREYLAAHGK